MEKVITQTEEKKEPVLLASLKETNGCLPHFQGISTTCIHGGQGPDPETGAVIRPISLSSTFVQKSPGNAKYEYSRSGNPTREQFEKLVAECEGGKYGLAFASGSATTVTILNLLQSGDHVISIDDVYGGTQRFFNKVLNPNAKVEFTFIDMTKDGELENAFRPTTKLVWIESPTNPTLKITDIKKASEIAKKHNCIVVVDNTFMSPFFQRPLSLGADIVVHSITKYMNGHTDVVGGVLICNDDKLYTQLKFLQNAIGAVPSPFDCFLVMRGMKTLPLRMIRHEQNAMQIAKWLEKHEKVEKVVYPGLPSHPQHEIAKKQTTGFGGMITFYLKGGLQQSKQFLEHLHIFGLAESLGGVDSLAEHPALMTHFSVPPETRKKIGILDNLIRLSVGLEDIDDLLKDLVNAMAFVEI